jgi:methylmalonyl-CoA mutase N-terminal domain/subunit
MERDEIEAGRARWQKRFDEATTADRDFTTLSGVEVAPLYGPQERDGRFERIGWPGEYPFTRGVHATGYRGKPWTIRQFAGFGNAEQTNERYKMILAEGGGGLSVAFDMPTLMGRDSDDPRSLGEVGHCGVAIDSAADMDVLFDGIDLGATTLHDDQRPGRAGVLHVPGRARSARARHLALERHPADRHLQGVHRAEGVALPPEPHLQLIGDLMEYCARDPGVQAAVGVRLPHPRGRLDGRPGAGVHAGRRFGYVELGLSRGLDVDVFAPGLSFFFDAHIDFFEEIAKFRAARRIWARWMRDVYGAKTDGRSGCGSTPRPPAFRSPPSSRTTTSSGPPSRRMAAVLGGTNSLHTNALDEVLALPSEHAAQIALRTSR